MGNIYKIVNLRIVSLCLSVQKAIAFLIDIFVMVSGIAGMEKMNSIVKAIHVSECSNVS